MAELLVRAVDKVHPTDPVKNLQLTKRGDVIAVQPNGWNWGTQELANPEWRIIHAPDLTQQQGDILLKADPPAAVAGRKRIYRLDLDHVSIPPAVKTVLGDNSRQNKLAVIPSITGLIMSKGA